MKLRYFILAAFSLTAIACDKKPYDTLPEPSQSSSNTFACWFKEQSYLVQGEPTTAQPLGVSFKGPVGGFYELTSKYDFRIFLNKFPAAGSVFKLRENDGHKSYAEYFDVGDVSKFGLYSTDSTGDTGTVYINYQKGNIVAGTFSFNASNEQKNHVQVTKGWFDVLQH